jgi:hypothetical protein
MKLALLIALGTAVAVPATVAAQGLTGADQSTTTGGSGVIPGAGEAATNLQAPSPNLAEPSPSAVSAPAPEPVKVPVSVPPAEPVPVPAPGGNVATPLAPEPHPPFDVPKPAPSKP